MSVNPHLNWITKNLEDTCDILDGQRIPLNEETRKTIKGGIPYYGANGVVDFINKYIFDEKLILLAEDGGYFSEYKTRPIAYMIKGKSWVNNHAHVLRVREKDGFSTEYVFYNLEHKNMMSYIKGSTRTKLNQAELRKIHILVPPLVEQRGIAEVLGTVDETIRRTDAVIAKAEELKRGLMQRLLTRGIEHAKFKQTELGEIPTKWTIETIGNIAETYSGGTPLRIQSEYYNGNIPWVKSGECNRRFIYDTEEKITEKGLQNSSAKWVPKDSILVAMYGATAGKVSTLKIKATTNQAICAIIPHPKKAVTDYLQYAIESQTRKLVSLTQGSGQPNLSQNTIKNVKLAVPPIEEQQKIANILLTSESLIENEITIKNRYIKSKYGLMQILLSGRVSVKLDEGGLHRINDG